MRTLMLSYEIYTIFVVNSRVVLFEEIHSDIPREMTTNSISHECFTTQLSINLSLGEWSENVTTLARQFEWRVFGYSDRFGLNIDLK